MLVSDRSFSIKPVTFYSYESKRFGSKRDTVQLSPLDFPLPLTPLLNHVKGTLMHQSPCKPDHFQFQPMKTQGDYKVRVS